MALSAFSDKTKQQPDTELAVNSRLLDVIVAFNLPQRNGLQPKTNPAISKSIPMHSLLAVVVVLRALFAGTSYRKHPTSGTWFWF